jgi:hypothetical protein
MTTVPVPRRMTVKQFREWVVKQPDGYELIDGVPQPLPAEKQVTRRCFRVLWAATVARADADVKAAGDWLWQPREQLDGRSPGELASEGWSGVARALEMLAAAVPGCTYYEHGRGPFNLHKLGRPDLLEEARHFARLESRARL